MKTFLLTLAAIIVTALQGSYAGDDFRVTIVKGDGEPKLTPEQIDQFKKAGVASPNDLPIIVCPSNVNPKLPDDPADTFQVIIENLIDKAVSVTMLDSDWSAAITFKLVDNKGTVYTIMHSQHAWMKNGLRTWTWEAHGTQKFATSFLALHSGPTPGLPWTSGKSWPAPAAPALARLTASFTYVDQNHKSITIASKATDVVLVSQ